MGKFVEPKDIAQAIEFMAAFDADNSIIAEHSQAIGSTLEDKDNDSADGITWTKRIQVKDDTGAAYWVTLIIDRRQCYRSETNQLEIDYAGCGKELRYGLNRKYGAFRKAFTEWVMNNTKQMINNIKDKAVRDIKREYMHKTFGLPCEEHKPSIVIYDSNYDEPKKDLYLSFDDDNEGKVVLHCEACLNTAQAKAVMAYLKMVL